LFQTGRVPGSDSTRQMSRKRSFRQRLTSSSRKQLADGGKASEGLKEGEDEPESAGALGGDTRPGKQVPNRYRGTGEAEKSPEGGSGEMVSTVSRGLSSELGQSKRKHEPGTSSEGFKGHSEAKEFKKGEGRTQAENGATVQGSSSPRRSDYQSSSHVANGRAELLQALETAEELCHVAKMDPESTVATVALLLHDVVSFGASEPIRPILRSMLALCERAHEQEGPLKALGNLISVAHKKTVLDSGDDTIGDGLETVGLVRTVNFEDLQREDTGIESEPKPVLLTESGGKTTSAAVPNTDREAVNKFKGKETEEIQEEVE
jgi:hypothetical protein